MVIIILSRDLLHFLRATARKKLLKIDNTKVSLSAESESGGTFAKKSPLTSPENAVYPFQRFTDSFYLLTIIKAQGLITSMPMYGLRTSGTVTDPSSF